MTRRELLEKLAKAKASAVSKNDTDTMTTLMLVMSMVRQLDLQASINEEKED